MTTSAQIVARFRDDITRIANNNKSNARLIEDMNAEVDALGSVAGIFGSPPVFPEQGDGFELADLIAAFGAITAFSGTPTEAQEEAVLRCRRD